MQSDHSLLLQIPVAVQSGKLDPAQTGIMEQKDHFVGIEMVRVRYLLLSITLLLTVNCLLRSVSHCAAMVLALCRDVETHTNVVTCMTDATVVLQHDAHA